MSKSFFAVNLNTEKNYVETDIKNIKTAELIYTNSRYTEIHEEIQNNSDKFKINNIYIGECAVYNINGQ